MLNPISFIDYDKISDCMMFLGQNTELRFNVNLARKGEDGKRYHFHKEFEYSTNKYIDKSTVHSIKRDFGYFMTIDRNGEFKESIMIRIQDILLFRTKLNQVAQWFQANDIFAIKNKKMIILGNHEPIQIFNLAMDKWLMFEPCIINYSDNSIPGVKMYLSSQTNFIDINVNTFMGFLYLISTIDMYACAQNIINSLPAPEFGTNLYVIDNMSSEPTQELGIKAIKDRNIPNRKNQSYFDKMDNL